MKKIIYILIVACGMSMNSCSDWLDVLPKNEQVTADYWKSKEDVEAVLASGYEYMRRTTPTVVLWSELRGASIYPFSSGGDNAKLHNFQLTATENVSKWGAFYQVINMANSVLDFAPGVPSKDDTYTEAAMRSHQAEAYFIRGLMYFHLVRNFRDVPLILNSYVDDSVPYSIAKSDEATIIAQIKADILTALATDAAKEFHDHDKWNGASKGRATKWALYALMADVCLWSEDYEGCIQYSDLLINATSSNRPAFMSIPEQWYLIFNPGNSNESIFELNWDQATFSQTSNSPYGIFGRAVTSTLQYSPAMKERFQDEILEQQEGMLSVRGDFASYAIPDLTADVPAYVIWKYCLTEIRGIDAFRPTSDSNWIVYRMADVMLMKAEALVRKGGLDAWQEALDIVNQIRDRALLNPLDITLSETDELSLLTCVLHERDMELAAEGKRWYDLVRFGKSQNYKYKTEFIEMIVTNNSSANDSWIRSVLKNNDAWYLPIHQSEIEANSLLEQNPYYSTTTK